MKDLTKGHEGKLIFYFALPMLLGNIFQQLYQVIDTVIVGNYLGNVAVAAVGASFPIIFLLVSLIIGIAIGMSVIVSQYFGAKDYVNVRKSADTMYIILLVTGVVVSILGYFFSEAIFTMMKLPQEVMPDAVSFMQIYMLGMIFMFLMNGIAAMLRGIGDSKTPLYFLAGSTVVNIILDFIFIPGFGWGVAGAAWATVISQALAFFSCMWWVNKKYKLVSMHLSKLTFDKEIFKKSLKIGLPSGLQQAFVALGMIALMRIVNNFGTVTISAYTIAGRIDSLAALPAMNISAALSTFVGQNIGANKHDRVRNGYRATLLMTTIISLIVSLSVVFFSHPLMAFFTNDPAVVEIGAKYLIIVCAFYVAFSTMFVNNGVLRGAGDTLIPMFITLLSLWAIRIPMAWFLSAKIGVEGIWWAIPIAWILGMVFSYIYYKTGRWKTKSVVKHGSAVEIMEEEELEIKCEARCKE